METTHLVFLHGLGTGPSGWLPQIGVAPSRRVVFVPDLTQWYPQGWESTVQGATEFVAGKEPVHLCGISLGALLALRIAADRPWFVRRLVVCAGFGQLPPDARRRVLAVAALARLVPKRFLHRQLVAEVPEPHRSVAAREISSLRSRHVARLMREAANARVNPELVVAPTLVLCGERDKANLPLSRSLAAALPNARLEVVPNAGHVANLDNPKAFTALLGEFLAG